MGFSLFSTNIFLCWLLINNTIFFLWWFMDSFIFYLIWSQVTILVSWPFDSEGWYFKNLAGNGGEALSLFEERIAWENGLAFYNYMLGHISHHFYRDKGPVAFLVPCNVSSYLFILLIFRLLAFYHTCISVCSKEWCCCLDMVC